MMESTRLTIFSHKLFRHSSRGFQTTGALTTQIDALALHFRHVTICAPVIRDLDFRGASVSQKNTSYRPLPHYSGRLDFLRWVPTMRRRMLSALADADLALVILPGYVGVLASILSRNHDCPTFQWVVGDWGQNVKVRRKTAVAHQLASRVATPLLDRLMTWITRDVLTFHNGSILYHKDMPHHHVRISSSIRESDLSPSASRLLPRSMVHLLFVGRLAAEKGVSHLLRAVALLRARRIPVKLHLVGAGEVEDQLRREAEILEVQDCVVFHGFVPHGEPLYEHYRQSDVLILPSLQDQQPKVLLEAMSQGLVVIATEVGGVPSVISDKDNGLLVPPADDQAIAVAVQRIIQDSALRRRLIQGGLEYARAHTVEAETARMIHLIKLHFNEREDESHERQ